MLCPRSTRIVPVENGFRNSSARVRQKCLALSRFRRQNLKVHAISLNVSRPISTRSGGWRGVPRVVGRIVVGHMHPRPSLAAAKWDWRGVFTLPVESQSAILISHPFAIRKHRPGLKSVARKCQNCIIARRVVSTGKCSGLRTFDPFGRSIVSRQLQQMHLFARRSRPEIS